MKLPKSVLICGKKWRVKKRHTTGGMFDGSKCIIYIGDIYKQDMLITYIHEVLEAILTERGHRYHRYDTDTNSGLRFSFNHDEFNNICVDLASSLDKTTFV